MNAMADEQCLWSNCVIKDFETGSFLSQSLSFKTYDTYITLIFTHLVLKLCKNKNL